MLGKFSKAELKIFDKLKADWENANEKLKEEITSFNDDIAEMFNERIHPLMDAFNEAADELNGFIEDTANDQREQYESRSERWQESEKGEMIEQWISDLEAIPAVSMVNYPEPYIETDDNFHDDERELSQIEFEAYEG